MPSYPNPNLNPNPNPNPNQESLHVQMSTGAAARGAVCFCGTDRHLDGSRIPFDGSWVQCDGCQLWCHRQCAGLKQTRAACHDVEYACPACSVYEASATRVPRPSVTLEETLTLTLTLTRTRTLTLTRTRTRTLTRWR